MAATTQLVPESVAVGDRAAILTERDVAALTGVSVDTLRFLRLSDAGPVYTEDQGRVRYSMSDVLKWQAVRRAAHQRLMDSYWA